MFRGYEIIFDFDEQADEANLLYGQQIKFFFEFSDVLNEIEMFNNIYDKVTIKLRDSLR